MAKPLRQYTLCRTVTYVEYSRPLATSLAEAKRRAFPTGRRRDKETRWQLVGQPTEAGGP